MIIHPSEMRVEFKEKMRGGEGTISITHLVEPERLKNARLLAILSIKPTYSIGLHQHNGETEYFIILKGAGTVVDNGVRKEIETGDILITGNGENHSITNTGSSDLELMSIIITY